MNGNRSETLAESTESPRITFIIKGLINTGKSTLFNSLFGKNISRTSMRRETMCQSILIEESTVHAFDTPEIASEITVNNQVVNPSRYIEKIPEVLKKIPLVHDLFPRFEGITYRYVETVGFDDPVTDPANKKWFSENIKWCDVLIFLTDKEKCMNNNSERLLMQNTLQDLVHVKNTLGKSIPLIVLVNKVEDENDDEVRAVISQCEATVNDMISKITKDYNFSIDVHFCHISAMTFFLYRSFLRNNTFDGMEAKDISKLCEIELGMPGKVRSKNIDEHAELASEIRKRIKSNPDQWKEICRFNIFLHNLSHSLLNHSKLPGIIIQQLRVALIRLNDPLPYHSEETHNRMLYIIRAYQSYGYALRFLEKDASIMKLEEEAKALYEKLFQHLLELQSRKLPNDDGNSIDNYDFILEQMKCDLDYMFSSKSQWDGKLIARL